MRSEHEQETIEGHARTEMAFFGPAALTGEFDVPEERVPLPPAVINFILVNSFDS